MQLVAFSDGAWVSDTLPLDMGALLSANAVKPKGGGRETLFGVIKEKINLGCK